VAPQLPAGWETVELEKLAFGGHTISLRATSSSLRLTHLSGPAPLTATGLAPDGSEHSARIEVGESVQW